MASLVSPDGTSFELVEGENLIGRGGREYNDPPKVDVGPLPGGATVSRRHARVRPEGDRWYIRVEPEARNPTLVGGRRVPGGEEALLVGDSNVQLGDVVLTFRAPVEVSRSDVTLIETEPPETRQPAVEPLPHIDVPEVPEPEPVPEPEVPVEVGATTTVAPIPPQPAPPVQPTPVAQPAPPTPPVQPVTPVPPRPRAAPAVTWPARLTERPDAVAGIGVSEFKRVNPFRGLMIDEAAWADAHDYHRILARLHLLAGHGWGIVDGLEVIADENNPGVVIIRPGLAVDPLGHVMVIGQERRLPYNVATGVTLYVAARLREDKVMPQRYWSDVDEYTRVVEKCETVVQTTPPTKPSLELARVVVDGPVRNAANLFEPRTGEIDLRFRERLQLRPRTHLAVAQLVLDDGGEPAGGPQNHQIGLRFLLREIGLTSPYRGRWGGTVKAENPIPPVSLLYLTGNRGFAVDDVATERLRKFLDAGGVLFADGCAGGEAGRFAASVATLAKSLGRELRPVTRWHPLLSARHPFALPPLKAGPTNGEGVTLAEGDGIILTTADYGCAWTGGHGEDALPRDTVRAALELGVNVAVFARQRQRPLEAIELEF
ncbi:MAG TPA: DUF4159 domain-containing protein [Chloroflexota bacterium]|nr:DUF4159 domain-containing protein [Chloroflexota bacterium]